MYFGIVFENFSADRRYQLSQKHQRLFDEIKYHSEIFKVTKVSKNGKFGQKRIF